MSLISENIKYLRKQKGMTQQEFSDHLDIKRSSLGAYEEGRANPNLETMIRLTELFNISLDQLLKEKLSEAPSQQVAFPSTSPVQRDISGKQMRVLSITVDKDDREYIDLVPQKAAASYLAGYADPEFVAELPKFRLPNLPRGTYRAFEITGDSMLPIQPGSILIGEYVQDWQDLKDGHPYIVIAEKEGVVFKRMFNRIDGHNELLLKSDNPSYPAFTVNIEDVVELWKAKAYISTIFPDGENSVDHLTRMVMELQQEVIKLKG